MTILVKIFGDLRKKIKGYVLDGALPLTIKIENQEINTIEDILEKLGIEKDETYHLFVNGVYSGFNKTVKEGDRVGIFPINMALLYKWYFKRNND